MPIFEIDLSGLYALGEEHPLIIMGKLFLYGGFIPVLWIIGWGFWQFWIIDRQTKFGATVNPVLLAVDVPKLNEQSPKAVELMFATLLGARSSFTKKELYWIGKYDPIFAFEVVSIEGYVQFLVRVWEKYRDAIEAAVYAQYPDAEITEVEDYTVAVPQKWPNDTYDLFGTEFVLSKPDMYPIRTYPSFEHPLSGEFKDPMASFLEGMSKILPGEQVWFQVLCQTTDTAPWVKRGMKEVKRLIGAKEVVKKGVLDKLSEVPFQVMDATWNAAIGPSEAPKKREDKPARSEMLFLSPGERGVVEQIQMKLSKIAYKCKIRWIYIAPKGQLRVGSIIAFLRGAIQQFTTLDMNKFGLAGLVTTKSDYFWQTNPMYYYLSLGFYKTRDRRMQDVFNSYKARSVYRGQSRPFLNIEELATIWHFPVIQVKAPVVKKTESKRAEPPIGLPTGGIPFRPLHAPPGAPPAGPPPNLPT